MAVLLGALFASLVSPRTSAAEQGFGADTPGGTGQPVYRVTSLADSGPGTLRDALSQGGRWIVFDVAGDINLSTAIAVRGAYVTIDGFSAPSPGITLRNGGLDIDAREADVHDIVVRGIRIRDLAVGRDGIAVEWGAHHVLIDHVSVDGCGDGNIDITQKAHDVTVAWSVFSGCSKNNLIGYQAQRVTLHHNVFVNSQWRNPWISYLSKSVATLSPDTMVDMRNNIIWAWGDLGGGTGVECGATANIVNNYFSSPNTSASRQANAIIMKTTCPNGGYGGYAFTRGNLSGDHLSFDVNSRGNESVPFPAPFVATHDTCIGARDALAGAGAEPLDSVDLGHLSQIALSACGESTPTPRPTSPPAPTATRTPMPATPTPTRTPTAMAPTATPTRAPTLIPPTATPTRAPTLMPPTATPTRIPPTATPTWEFIPNSNPNPTPTPTTVPVSTPPAVEQITRVRVAGGVDDVEEMPDGTVRMSNSAIRLGASRALAAFRFPGVSIPRGAKIVSAKLQLWPLNRVSAAISLRYSGEKTATSSAFAPLEGDLSSRIQTGAFVDDRPARWYSNRYATSPELGAIVQEIVDQPSWWYGSNLTLFVANRSSTNYRRTASCETSSCAQAAMLEVRWTR